MDVEVADAERFVAEVDGAFSAHSSISSGSHHG